MSTDSSSFPQRYQPPALVWEMGEAGQSGAAPWIAVFGLGAMLGLSMGVALDAWPVAVGIATLAWVAGYRELRTSNVVTLAWDRQQWSMSVRSGRHRVNPNVEVVAPCVMNIVLDLQGTVLARVAGPTGPTYSLWLSRRSDPRRWHRLRCALFSARQP